MTKTDTLLQNFHRHFWVQSLFGLFQRGRVSTVEVRFLASAFTIFVLSHSAFSQLTAVSGQKKNPTISLKDAIEYGLTHRPDIYAGSAREGFSKANIGLAKSQFMPQASLNGFGTDGSYQSVIMSAPGVNPSYLLTAPSGQFADLNLMLMVPIFDGGSNLSNLKAKQQLSQSSTESYQQIVSDASHSIISAYLHASEAKSSTKVDEDRIAADRQLVANVETRVQQGLTINAEVDRAKAKLDHDEATLNDDRANVQKDVINLNLQMGVQSATKEFDVDPALPKWNLHRSLSSLIAEAINIRPALAAIKDVYDSKVSLVNKVKGTAQPQVYGFAFGDITSLGRNGSGKMAGIIASFPLFDGGQRKAQLSAASYKEEIAKSNYQQAILTVRAQVRDSWIAVQTAKADIKAAQSEIVAASASYKVIQLRVENGKSILVEQLDALQALSQAQLDGLEAQFKLDSAINELEQAVGLPVGTLTQTGGLS